MLKEGDKALAIDLKELRKRAGLTAERMAEIMECEPGHYSKIERRRTSLVLTKAVRAAAVVGPLTVLIPGVGFARVAVTKKRWTQTGLPPMVPAEAALLELQEVAEAMDHLPQLQRALLRGNRDEVVHIIRETIVEPLAAIEAHARAFERRDPTLMQEAQAAYERAMNQGTEGIANHTAAAC